MAAPYAHAPTCQQPLSPLASSTLPRFCFAFQMMLMLMLTTTIILDDDVEAECVTNMWIGAAPM